MVRTILSAVLAFSLLAPTVSMAKDANEEAIDARRAFFQMVKFNAGTLFAMAKGKQDYDAAAAKTAAENLHTLTMMQNGAMWPAGSHKEAYPGKTRALKAGWDKYPELEKVYKDWQAAAGALAAVAGDGLDAVKSKVGDVGKACKACHDNFRAKKFE